MKPSFTNSTRAMCASAFLLGESFRSRVLDDPVEKGLAVAPELDIDVRLLAQVCKFARARDAKYDLFLILALLLCLPLWALDSNVGIAGVVVTTAAIFLYKTYDERSNLLPRFRKDRAGSAQMSLFTSVQLDTYLSSALASDEQNVIVYSGFNPFVGAGVEIGSWSFSLDVSRPAKDAGPPGPVRSSAAPKSRMRCHPRSGRCRSTASSLPTSFSSAVRP
ncbi:hypothetical protein BVER_05200 [Candidatus Burkholderia verschuerenii]|uniref:Uncharacterized protein n=1 Tax=Candidatus Burkholderia verschuerenii TaxID=242163 RepID=A0A0L0M6N3_9BURK|nr:hypothetical protein [Candidatus Burkholderia verschuerenii]KND58317.1 hypothetical protein BVER_05200 [Candidatus Burkholderia verschuerenii]